MVTVGIGDGWRFWAEFAVSGNRRTSGYGSLVRTDRGRGDRVRAMVGAQRENKESMVVDLG